LIRVVRRRFLPESPERSPLRGRISPLESRSLSLIPLRLGQNLYK